MTLIAITILLLFVIPGLIFLIAKIVTRSGKVRLPFVSYPEDPPTPGSGPVS